MPQLQFSIDERTAVRLAERAAARGMTLSRYLAELVKGSEPDAWPPGYVSSVAGSCAEAPIDDPDALPPDDVEV